MEDKIDAIKAKLAQIRDAQYEKYNYKPVTKAYQSRTDRNSDKDFTLKQMCKHLDLEKSNKIDQDDIDITKADIFVRPSKDKEQVGWDKLDIETRVQLVEYYLSAADMTPPLSEEIITQVIELVQDDKLKRKSDIQYDAVNKRVVSIKVLKYDEEKDQYYINLKETKNKELARKRIKNLVG